MYKTVELKILDITNSQAQIGAYAILMGEVDGLRQLPIIIGPTEAQATLVQLKGIKPPRPLTHDLFTTSLAVLGARIIRVLIYKAKEGIFYSYIYFKKDEEEICLDSRTSDAIALAVRADCPILIYDFILEREQIHILDSEEEPDTDEQSSSDKDKQNTQQTLEEKLDQAIKEENYELAARIRDQINSTQTNH